MKDTLILFSFSTAPFAIPSDKLHHGKWIRNQGLTFSFHSPIYSWFVYSMVNFLGKKFGYSGKPIDYFRFSFPNLKSDLQIFVLNFTYTHLNSQWWCILLGADVPFSCDKFHYDKGTLYSDYNEICSWDLKHVIILRNRIERKKKKHFYIL